MGREKISQTYRLKDPLKNFRIRVKIAQQRSQLAELFESEEETRDANFLENEELIIAWQEKIFASYEARFYSDEKNCDTDERRAFRQLVLDGDVKGSRIYTRTNKDPYFAEESGLTEPRKSALGLRNATALPAPANRKPFCERYNRKVVDQVPGEQRIRANHYLYRDFDAMHIMADLSPNGNELYDLCEARIILCTITVDKAHKTMKIDPDFTSNEPYEVRGIDMSYDYWLEHVSEQQSLQDLETELKELEEEVTQRLSFREAQLFPEIDFPPSNVLRLFVNLEILAASRFPYDAIFVSYHIQLPEHWSTSQSKNLTGRTQRSEMRNGSANFGYVAEFSLDFDLACLEDEDFSPAWPWLLVSVASLDSWTRYRIEGYAAEPIPAASGRYDVRLKTWRPVGDWLNILRRFFTGGTSELQEIAQCGIPRASEAVLGSGKLDKSNLHTTTSGEVELRLNVASQSRSFLQGGEFKRENFQRLSAGRLMNSVNDVLRQFNAARDRMIRARIMDS